MPFILFSNAFYILFICFSYYFQMHFILFSNAFYIIFKCLLYYFQMRFILFSYAFHIIFKCFSYDFQMRLILFSYAFHMIFTLQSTAKPRPYAMCCNWVVALLLFISFSNALIFGCLPSSFYSGGALRGAGGACAVHGHALSVACVLQGGLRSRKERGRGGVERAPERPLLVRVPPPGARVAVV